MKLIDVCISYGFSDYLYLYRAFRKNYNCTPNEYRKIYSQKSLNTKPIFALSHEHFYNEEDTPYTLKQFMK